MARKKNPSKGKRPARAKKPARRKRPTRATKVEGRSLREVTAEEADQLMGEQEAEPATTRKLVAGAVHESKQLMPRIRAMMMADDGSLTHGFDLASRQAGDIWAAEEAKAAAGGGPAAVAKQHSPDREDVAQAQGVRTPEDSALNIFQLVGSLIPPFDPEVLCDLFEHSSTLRPNVDAYQTNIDSFGHRFEPVVKLDSPDAHEKVRQAIWAERMRAMDDKDFAAANESVKPTDEEPTEKEVLERIELIRSAMIQEWTWLENFFKFINPKRSFVKLRTITRQDIELLGNGYWEAVRNGAGEIIQFGYLPGFTVRLMPVDLTAPPMMVDKPVKVSPFTYGTYKQPTRFRRYIQLVTFTGTPAARIQTTSTSSLDIVVWFKEFGDNRIMSSATGEFYDSLAELEKAEEGVLPANEIVHFDIHSPRGPYGVPRWIGALLSVVGTRQAEEVNFLYFDNKSIPPLLVTVQGGTLTEQTVKHLKDFISSKIKGRKNFHKILILEAESGAGPVDANSPTSRTRIDVRPLTAAIHKDGLFMEYMARNENVVGRNFRLPPILRGDTRDFNRACYDEQTETLTDSGWKRLGDFKPTDKIAAYDPGRDLFQFVKPERLHVYEVDEDLLHFRSQVADIMVTEDHRMLARGLRDEKFAVHKSQDIPWARYMLKTVAGRLLGNELADFRLPKVEGCEIERGHDHRVSCDAGTFLEFLGYWLSEGSLLRTDHPASPYIVTLSQKAGPTADKMRDCLKRTGWHFSESQEEATGMRRWTLSNRCLRDWLLENCGGGSDEKHIPEWASSVSGEQARILFDALMAGDGHWDARPNRTAGFYPSVSRRLCDDIQALAIGLGYRAALAMHYPASGNRKTCWRVMLSEGRDAEFRAPPERIHYQGRVYCFSVPSHGFFVTRRNGKVAIQGNTAQAAVAYAEQQVFSSIRNDFDWWINSILFPELQIRYWEFRSNGPQLSDPERVSKIAKEQLDAGTITIDEARQAISILFPDVELPAFDQPWSRVPLGVIDKRIQAASTAVNVDEEPKVPQPGGPPSPGPDRTFAQPAAGPPTMDELDQAGDQDGEGEDGPGQDDS